MTIALDTAPLTIAGHTFALQERTGGVLNLRIALRDGSLAALTRALAKLDGVRVTGGPEGTGSQRCYLVHCPGFKMVLSAPVGQTNAHADDNFAFGLVSRAPQAALAVVSDLGSVLDRLMNQPPPAPAQAPIERHASSSSSSSSWSRTSSPLRRSALAPGKPLTRKTKLTRKTPLGRGKFR